MNGAIEWFARNKVAANLLMFGILIAGLLTFPTIKQTVFPDFEIHYVSVTVVYPGASPEDIEKSVTLRIEEELQDVLRPCRTDSTSTHLHLSIYI